MKNLYKYLDSNNTQWGVSVLNAGSTKVCPEEEYPKKTHPAPHYFSWNNGRVLNEYQLVFIKSGQGFYEDVKFGSIELKEGAVFLLSPETRHRYRPMKTSGWDEMWVGFSSEMIKQSGGDILHSEKSPIFYPNDQFKVFDLFSEIVDKTFNFHSGNLSLIIGSLYHLIGHLQSEISCDSKLKFSVSDDEIVFNAQNMLKTRLSQGIHPEDVARELNMGYSKFRKLFKNISGVSPGRYLLNTKIELAVKMLLYTNKSIKEISYDSGFDSPNYFSTIFKSKIGKNPCIFRVENKIKDLLP